MTIAGLARIAVSALVAGTLCAQSAAGWAAGSATAEVRSPLPSDPWSLPDWRTAPPPRPASGEGGAVRTPFPQNPWTRLDITTPAPRPVPRVTPPASAADGAVRTPFPADPWTRMGAVTPAPPQPVAGGAVRTPFPANPWQRPDWHGPAPRSVSAEMPARQLPPASPRPAAEQSAEHDQPAQLEDFWHSDGFFPMRWALAGYLGLGTEGGIEDLPLFDAQFNAAYVATIEPSLRVLNLWDWLSVEAAVNLTQYFNRQTNTEANAFLIFRWLKFPWDRWLDTSFAVGEGISYATPIGSIEKRRSPEVTSNFLNYLMFELEVAPPDAEHWSGFMRIHHRSGVFGLYNDVSNGSNFLVWGVRYRF